MKGLNVCETAFRRGPSTPPRICRAPKFSPISSRPATNHNERERSAGVHWLLHTFARNLPGAGVIQVACVTRRSHNSVSVKRNWGLNIPANTRTKETP